MKKKLFVSGLAIASLLFINSPEGESNIFTEGGNHFNEGGQSIFDEGVKGKLHDGGFLILLTEGGHSFINEVTENGANFILQQGVQIDKNGAGGYRIFEEGGKGKLYLDEGSTQFTLTEGSQGLADEGSHGLNDEGGVGLDEGGKDISA